MAFAGGRGGWGGGHRSSTAPVVEEFPAWVRQCADEFKQDKCFFAHEQRTVESWRRFNKRLEISPYKRLCRADCTDDIKTLLPHLDASLLPLELRRIVKGAVKRQGTSRASALKRKVTARLERGGDDDGADALLLGEDGIEDPNLVSLTADDLRRGEDDGEDVGAGGAAGGAGADGEGADGERRRGSDAEDGDEELEEEDEDMEQEDYAVGKHYDDDEDLVDEDGGGSDDEEARYGTY